MENGIKISEETFDGLKNTDTKLHAIFEAIVATNSNICAQKEQCERRFKKIENRRWRDKGIAGAAGLVGGYLATMTRKIFSI